MIKKIGIALAIALFSHTAMAGDVAAHWKILEDKSAIEWTATYGDKPVTGSFPAFTADVAFDVDHVDASRATVKIDVAKIKSADRDAQDNLPTGDWFAASQFPQAVFETTSFKHIKDDQFEVEGTLSVRNKSAKVTLPFTAKFYDDKDASPPVHYARIQGETTIKRTAIGVGTGDWSQTDTVHDDVKLVIRLEARQVP